MAKEDSRARLPAVARTHSDTEEHVCFASRGVDLRGWGLNSRKHTALASDIGGEVVNGRGEGMCLLRAQGEGRGGSDAAAGPGGAGCRRAHDGLCGLGRGGRVLGDS